jgi:putative two-component system response regulator
MGNAQKTVKNTVSSPAKDIHPGITDLPGLKYQTGNHTGTDLNAVKPQEIYQGIVHSLSSIVEIRDQYTALHQQRVAHLALEISKSIGLKSAQVVGTYVATAIHDIGKLNVPAEILNKPGKLSELEFGIIKTHPQIGYEILKWIDFPWPIAQITLEHHERINGSGYPNGLKAEKILIEARVLAVADVVEAMASDRPYRKALGLDKALEEITLNKGILYDSDVVDAALRLFAAQRFFW